ncbi:hypothetical protein L5515_014042 [Caenorhabditis briggsae]|uniref:Uncharacterized protein n=1 Tax=Caenorhabditis briggsae TaxID=6238 RepID=A0AAE9J6B9_CAEBR|nr:hypothetical protein L5515_014042 [Caenorhabditis briggsae]
MHLKSTIFTLVAAIFQGFTLVWYILSYVPGGERGLFFMTSLFTSFLRRSTSTTEKDNDGEKPNRKTPEKDQQILKRKIENRAQQKTGRGCC